METAAFVVAAVLTVVAVSAVASRYRLSAPLLLIVVGIVVSLADIVGSFRLEPEIILVGILPPLLYSAAVNTSFVDFRANRKSIASLSVGLVIFSTLVVGLAAWWLLPGLPLAAGFALGAVVAPPDAVATTAIARRVGMPRSIVQVLEGESLVNDATALTALRAALAALAGTVTALQVGMEFVLAAGGGVVVGLLIAWVYTKVRRRISNPAFDTALSFTIPFLAYLPAEAIHASGVTAVVVAGLYVGHTTPLVQSGTARITTESNWRTVAFVLENGVFLLIGLELRDILEQVDSSGQPWVRIALVTIGVFLTCILARVVWVFGGGVVSRLLARGSRPNWRELTVISWAGMRGVVTLAAALILPMDVPYRPILLLVAFVVVVGTLLAQGLSLPWLVRRMRLTPPDLAAMTLQRAVLIERANRAGAEDLDRHSDDAPAEVLDRIAARTEDRRNAAWERLAVEGSAETPIEAYTRIRLQMLLAERRAVISARDQGRFDDDVIRSVIQILDVEEAMLDNAEAEGARRMGTLRVPTALTSECRHLQAATDLPVPVDLACDGCLADGTTWVHLRMCLTCGYRGCCESSVSQHSMRHFEQTGHPVMRSIEPGESWRWCHVDQVLG